MERKFVFSVILLLIFLCNNLPAYENIVTHPAITTSAAKTPKLGSYLINNLGLTDGVQSKIPSNGETTVLDWLRKGSTDEDIPMCRATNHFHNPIKSWDQSYMSDDTSPLGLLVRKYCELSGWPYSARKSNVTWGTGYLSPTSSKIVRPNQWMGWDDARNYYYWALSAASSTDRETYFAKTFQALGQVSHLLQDMAVPAHVRNDFSSHLSFIGFISMNPGNWFGNLYEDYVKNNPGIVTSANPEPIALSNPRLTDFWDTDRYTGNNPSTSPLGLAEFTHANYFSDTTIINNKPSAEHYFDYPVVNSQNHQICEDYAFGKNRIRKYVSRRDRGECPPVTEERKADHFAAISLLEADASGTNENLPFLYLWLDKNVHNTYAKELVPQAISYSAGLLEYFFRGNLQVTAVPIFYQGNLSFMRLIIKNMTTEETMRNGNFVLTYRYTPHGGAANGLPDVLGQAWGLDGSAVVPCIELQGATKKGDGTIEGGGETVVDFIIYPALPKTDYDSIKFTLAFQGTLGNEGGIAVIGKTFAPGEVIFEEEWDNGFDGNNPWGHTGINLDNFNPTNNGVSSNQLENGDLVKDNIRYLGYSSGRFNQSVVCDICGGGQFANISPIRITPNTYLMYKIDEMSIAPAEVPASSQYLLLSFTDKLALEISQDGQMEYWNDVTAYYTFPLGVIIVENIYEMFKGGGMTVPEPFYLRMISFNQFLYGLSAPSSAEHHQRMRVDFIRIVEGKEQ
jgi:hypothetical protein